MKKLIALLGLLMLISLIGCSPNKLAKPETNLEFWIAENVDDVAFSKYQEKYRYGFMPGSVCRPCPHLHDCPSILSSPAINVNSAPSLVPLADFWARKNRRRLPAALLYSAASPSTSTFWMDVETMSNTFSIPGSLIGQKVNFIYFCGSYSTTRIPIVPSSLCM